MKAPYWFILILLLEIIFTRDKKRKKTQGQNRVVAQNCFSRLQNLLSILLRTLLTNHHALNKDLKIDIASVGTLPWWNWPQHESLCTGRQLNWDKPVSNVTGILAESGARPHQSCRHLLHWNTLPPCYSWLIYWEIMTLSLSRPLQQLWKPRCNQQKLTD